MTPADQPVQPEPWMREAAEEVMALYRERPVDPIYFHLHRWNEEALAAIIAKHKPPVAVGALVEEKIPASAEFQAMSLVEKLHKLDTFLGLYLTPGAPLLGAITDAITALESLARERDALKANDEEREVYEKRYKDAEAGNERVYNEWRKERIRLYDEVAAERDALRAEVERIKGLILDGDRNFSNCVEENTALREKLETAERSLGYAGDQYSSLNAAYQQLADTYAAARADAEALAGALELVGAVVKQEAYGPEGEGLDAQQLHIMVIIREALAARVRPAGTEGKG